MPRTLHITWVFGRAWAGAVLRTRLGLVPAEVRRSTFAVATRLALEASGPAFVKLGQLLSVRPDVFSPELVFELGKLRDAAPPVPLEGIRRVIRRELGSEPEGLFDEFDPVPVASASIAQVHRARLREDVRPVWGPVIPAGTRVAVKVVRPGVRREVAADLAWARRVIRLLGWLPTIRRMGVTAVLDEFEAVVEDETDMRREGRVADRFGFDFHSDDSVRVPRVIWSTTTKSVLTMEFLDGWRLSELDAAARAGIDGERLARHGAVAFMRQVLVHGRFHADLHPSNLFVTPDDRIAYLDFGIVGHLDREARLAIQAVLAAIVAGDPAGALDAAAGLGLRVPRDRRVRLEADLAELMDRTLAHDRDVRYFGLGLLRLLARHRVEVPRGFGLLVKALVTVEGVARALYPEIDIIETARPFMALTDAPSVLYSRSRASLRLPVR